MRVKLLAIATIISGVLVLLGWFTLPVRVAMLIAIAMAAVYSLSSFRAKRGISHESTAVPIGEIPRRNLGMTSGTIAIVAAAAAAALLLWHSGTTDPIRSPWSVVPVPFFFLYGLLAMMMVVSTVRSSLLTSYYFLLLTSSLVAILIYPLGFGFDHFIHAAAERIIATTGALSPPPFFYSGHYGLTLLLADLLPGVGVDLADRLLTPLLTVAFLVPLAYRSLRLVLPDHAARFGLSSLLIVPFLPLAVSTPQATANVFALATMFLLVQRPQSSSIFSPLPAGRGSDSSREAQGAKWERGWVTPLTTALAALLSQPMTGIIAIAIVAIASVRRWLTKKTRSYFFGQFLSPALTAVVAAAGAMAIPLAFAVAGRIIPNLDLRIAFNPLPALQRLSSALRDTFAITAIDFATADALAVARVLLPILWTGLAIAGALTRGVTMFSRPLKFGDTSPSVSHVLSSPLVLPLILAPLIALAAAVLVATTVTVPTQLGEEQSQFPLRLVQLAALLATPLAAIGLGTLLSSVFSPSLRRGSPEASSGSRLSSILKRRDERGSIGVRYQPLAAALTLGTLATFTLLLAYPRDDVQARSGLWSVSADDIAAVHAIANDAGDVPYVVLANQMLGAAAIHELGFRPAHRLVDGQEILAFPLPAGGPIARQFWNYVSQDTACLSLSFRGGAGRGACPYRQPISAAMDLVGANRAYVVLHDYWRNSERLAAATAAIADAEVGQFSHLRIFRFTR